MIFIHATCNERDINGNLRSSSLSITSTIFYKRTQKNRKERNEIIIYLFVFFSFQTTEQIQNLTVSSTTNPSGHSSSTISPIHGSSHGSHNKNLLKDSTITTSGGKPQNLSQRIKFLQSQLAHAPMPSITSKRRQLPSIEEAWNLPISAEMSSRQQQSAQANQQRSIAKGSYSTQVRVLIISLVYLNHREKFHN